MARLSAFSADAQSRGHYDRAVQYLYLSETRGSFAIEHETPSASKEARFVQMLHRVSEPAEIDEERLVAMQNVAVRDAFSQEASYRTRQNWLESRTGRISRYDDEPEILQHPGTGPYRYFCADREVRFLAKMIQIAIEDEIPRELAYLSGYNHAIRQIDAEFDLPQKDISRLVRMIHGNGGHLSRTKRSGSAALPDDVLERIEAIVQQAFAE